MSAGRMAYSGPIVTSMRHRRSRERKRREAEETKLGEEEMEEIEEGDHVVIRGLS